MKEQKLKDNPTILLTSTGEKALLDVLFFFSETPTQYLSYEHELQNKINICILYSP